MENSIEKIEIAGGSSIKFYEHVDLRTELFDFIRNRFNDHGSEHGLLSTNEALNYDLHYFILNVEQKVAYTLIKASPKNEIN